MINCVSLDFDWTLAEMRPPTYEIYQSVLREFGYFFELETIKQRFKDTVEDVSDSLQRRVIQYARLSPSDQKKLLRDFNRERLRKLEINHEDNLKACLDAIERRARRVQKRVLYDDVQETLERLIRLNIELFVVSGNNYSRIETTLRRYGCLDFFRGVLTPDNCDMIKSSIFQLLPQLTGFSPREIIHCGDNVQDDMIPALAQSMNAVLIRRP